MTTIRKFKRFAIATDDEIASRVGLRILKRGGNVVDAAVAIALTLCVTKIASNGIGGYGGFMLLNLPNEGELAIIDYNTRAPKMAREDVYEFIEEHIAGWKVTNNENEEGFRSISIPGTLAGLGLALEEYGNMNMNQILDYVISVTRRGVVIDELLRRAIIRNLAKLRKFKETTKLLLVNGEAPPLGHTITMRGLINALEIISRRGVDEFYNGEIGEKLANYLEDNDSLLTFEDLQRYSPTISKPLSYKLDEYTILVPRDCSGGVTTLQILGSLNLIEEKGSSPYDRIEELVNIMRNAWRDRLKYLGDPDYFSVPYPLLLAESRLRELLEEKSLKRSGTEESSLGEGTIHLVVMSSDGDAVSLSQTLRSSFGSGVTVPGYDIILNNGMGLFDPRPDRANSIAPLKRPLSNMCPVIVLKDDATYCSLGSPGGRRIISIVSLLLINLLIYDKGLDYALSAPRIHTVSFGHVYLDNRVERRVELKLIKEGHKVRRVSKIAGPAVCILMEDGRKLLAACERGVPLGT